MPRYNPLHHTITPGIALSLLLPSPLLADHHPEAKKAPAALQDKKEQKMDPNQQAMMEAWMKAAQPGPPHQRLRALAGTWDATIKAWMDPQKPPQESKGTSQSKMILGDRFLQEEQSATMMGKPFSGLGLTGYDNTKKKYVAAWADSMGTMITMMEGDMDPSGKVMTMSAEYADPISGKKVPQKYVTRIESDTRHVFEIHEPGPDGKEWKTLEITYTRAK